MDQLQVDVENRLLPRFSMDDVIVPNLFKHRAGGGTVFAHFIGRGDW